MRTARILSLVVLAVGAVGALAVSEWIVWAEDNPPPEVSTWEGSEPPHVEGLSQKAARAAMEPFWQQAKQAQGDAQWDLASRQFADIADRIPEGSLKQNALLQVGKCLARAGRTPEALQKYDEVVAIGSRLLTGGADESESGGYPKRLIRSASTTIKDNIWQGLCEKVFVCHEAGDNTGALQAIQCLRAWFPAFDNVKKVIPIQAQIEGRDAQLLLAEEEAAGVLAEQAKQARGAKQTEQALQLADEVLSRYPNSAAALVAKNTKAEVLWRSKRQEEAKAYYEEIRASTGTVAPDAPLARSAAWHCAFLEAFNLGKRLIHNRNDPGLTQADWQHAHDLCDVVRRWDPEDIHRAEMGMLRAELYYWRGQYTKSVELLDQVLQAFEGRIALKKGRDATALKCLVMNAHHAAGIVHMESGHPEEAVSHFTIALNACKDDPDAMQEDVPIAASACYGLWMAYVRMGAKQDALAVERLLRERWPDSRPAYLMRHVDHSFLLNN